MRPWTQTKEVIVFSKNRQFQLSKKMKDCDSISFFFFFCYHIKVNQITYFNDADGIQSASCKSFSDLKVRNKVRDKK